MLESELQQMILRMEIMASKTKREAKGTLLRLVEACAEHRHWWEGVCSTLSGIFIPPWDGVQPPEKR